MGLTSRVVQGAVPSAGLVAVAMLTGAMAVETTPMLEIEQSGSSAWLALSQSGTAVLYDGSLPDQAALALLPVAEPGSDLEIAQIGADALVLDRTSGTVTRIDGATHTTAAVARVAAGPAPDAEMVLSGDRLWIIDGAGASRLDPISLHAYGEPITMPTDHPDDVAVDGAGALWFTAGGEAQVVGDRSGAALPVGSAGLGTAGRSPVALDPEEGLLRFLPDGPTCGVDVGAGVELLESTTGAVSHDPDSGALTLVEPSCDTRTFPGAAPGSNLSEVAQVGRWMVAVDTATARAVVVDTDAADGAGVVWIEVPDVRPDLALDLVAAGDAVFYNQPAIDLVGVIEPGSGLAVPLSRPTGGSEVTEGLEAGIVREGAGAVDTGDTVGSHNASSDPGADPPADDQPERSAEHPAEARPLPAVIQSPPPADPDPDPDPDPPAQVAPTPDPLTPVALVGAEATSIRVGGLTFTVTTNDVCSAIEYSLIDAATMTTVRPSTTKPSANGCGGPRHVLDFPNLENGTEYILDATVIGTPAANDRPGGRGEVEVPSVGAVTFFPAALPPPEPMEVAYVSHSVSTTSSSITLTVVTNDVCGSLNFRAISEGGILAGQGEQASSCGTTRSITFTDLPAGTGFRLDFFVVGAPSDGGTPAGLGQSEPATDIVATRP